MGLFDIFKKKNGSGYSDALEFEKQGKLDEAEAIFKKVSTDDPIYAIHYIEFLVGREKWEEVVKEGKRLYSKHESKHVPPILKTLAECYRFGKGTPRNLTEAYRYMDYYKMYANESERNYAVEFLFKCTKEFIATWTKYDKMSSSDLEKLRNSTPEPADIDILKSVRTAKGSLTYLKWHNREIDRTKDYAQLGDTSSIRDIVYGPSINKAYEFGMKSARNGETWALVALFWRVLLRDGQSPEKLNFNEMIRLLEEGARKNDTDCMFALSVCYTDNMFEKYALQHTPAPYIKPYHSDPDKFFKLLKKAYDGGNKNPGLLVFMAQYYAMGKIWTTNRFDDNPFYVQKTMDIDQKKALDLLKEASEIICEIQKNGSIYEASTVYYWIFMTNIMLTIMYFDGFGCEKNTEMAYKYLHNGNEPDEPVSKLYVSNAELRILTLLRRNMSDAESPDAKFKRLFGVLSKNEEDSEDQTNEEE